jgi:hypothetical protein
MPLLEGVMRRATVFAGALVTLGVLSAGVAGADNVSIGIQIGTPPPPIVVHAPPQIVVIPGTSVYYAPAVEANFFFHSGRYYTYHEGAWFHAKTHNGPWSFVALEHVPRPVLAVPVAYYKIPPGHAKKAGPPPWAGHGHGKGPKHKGKHGD